MIEGMILPISCLDEDGLPSVANKAVSHIITDPPYSKYVHAGNRRSQKKRGEIVAPKMSFEHLSAEERELVASEFVRVCDGWIIVFCDLEGVGGWKHDLVRAGAKPRNTLTWRKTNCAPKFHGDGPAQGCEAAVVCWAGQGRSRWNSGGMPGYYEAMAPRKERNHSTQKPLDMSQQIVADFTRPGDLILDAYAGGGTLPAAAKSMGRRFAGYEIDAHQAIIANETVEATAVLVHPMRPRMSQTKARALGGVVLIGGKQVASFPVQM